MLSVAHLYFLQPHRPTQKNPKEPPSKHNRHEMTTNNHDRKEGRSANTGLAKVAVQCSVDTFLVNQSLVLRINFCGENRHLRQARNRYGQV